jgi:hypothetical protein
MILGPDNAVLLTDLDAQGFDLVNVGFLDENNLVTNDDIRLYDPRPVLDGSVTDDSVSEDANIVQSKLSLNGTIPAAWLGAVNTTEYPIAARGDLPEKIASKNVANGYPGLDANGRMLASTVPPGPGSGTLSSISLLVPDGMFVRGGAGPPAVIFDVFWYSVQPICWFGINATTPVHAYPSFNVDPFPSTFVPNLSGTNFATGTFDTDQLPVAIGVGGTHSPGVVPDPGNVRDGQPGDYLARDMTYKPMSTGIAYQPTLTGPSITFLYYEGLNAMVYLTSTIPGVSLFYSLNNGVFTQIQNQQGFLVPAGTHLSVYAAKIGWNNSTIFTDIIPDPPEPPGGGTEPPPQ